MGTLIEIFLHAPSAILYGRIAVDEESSLYGWPARIAGVLILHIALFAIGDVVYWQFIRKDWDWPEWYFGIRIVGFFGTVVVCGFLCLVYREPNLPDQEDVTEVPER